MFNTSASRANKRASKQTCALARHLVEACPHAQGLKLRLSGLSPIQQVRGQAAKFLDLVREGDSVRGHLRVQEVLDVRLAGARRRPWLP